MDQKLDLNVVPKTKVRKREQVCKVWIEAILQASHHLLYCTVHPSFILLLAFAGGAPWERHIQLQCNRPSEVSRQEASLGESAQGGPAFPQNRPAPKGNYYCYF